MLKNQVIQDQMAMNAMGSNPNSYGLANSLNLDQDQRFKNTLMDINSPSHPSNLPNYGVDKRFVPNPTGQGLASTAAGVTPGMTGDKNIDYLQSKEGANNTYTTPNAAGSSAYGRYQFMPSTAKMYASKIGIDPNKWDTPENQDKIMQYANQDYANYLQKWDRQDSPSNRYVVHQLGPSRAKRYFTDSLTDKDFKVMNDNLPSDLRAKDNETIRRNWMNKYNPMF